MNTVNRLALEYAQTLVSYYEAVNSDWSDKERAVRLAVDAMNDAQNALAKAAKADGKGENL